MAKAYMTSLPNTTDTQRNFIKTVDTPKVPAMDYRSGFKDVGAAIDNTNKFLGEYSQMKYEGFQADLDRLELEHLHEMQDATDPCELEEINQKWQKNYNTALKDDFWAKSYYKSSFYKKWQDRNHEAQQKIYYAKQHEFAEICATSTLNKMAETASMLDNPADVQQYLVNGEAMLANTKHLTAEAKYKLMTNFYKDTVSRLYESDPNKAVAFLDSVGNKYDAYGVSSEEIRNKAENYNKALRKEAEREQAKAEKQALQEEKMSGIALAQAVSTGKISEAEATKIAGDMSPMAWNEYRKAAPKSSKDSKTDYTEVHEAVKNLPSPTDEDFDDKVAEIKLSRPEWNSSQFSRFNDLTKALKETAPSVSTDTSNPITVEDRLVVDKVAHGEQTVSNEDIRTLSHGNSTLAKELTSARNTYNTKQEKDFSEKEKTKEKEISEANKKRSKQALGNINAADDEDIADVVKENAKYLTEEDWAQVGTRISSARRRLNERREKANAEAKKALDEKIENIKTAEQNERFNRAYDLLKDNSKAFTDEQINNLDVTQQQIKELKARKEKTENTESVNEEKNLKEQRVQRNKNFRAEASKVWEQGKIISNTEEFLDNYPYLDSENRDTVQNWLFSNNEKVLNANWDSIKDEFYRYVQHNRTVTADEISNFISNIPDGSTGKNYQEMFEDLSKINDSLSINLNEGKKSILNKFDTLWGKSENETSFEKEKRTAAKELLIEHLNGVKNEIDIDKFNDQFIMENYIKYKPTRNEVVSDLITRDVATGTVYNFRNTNFEYDKNTKMWHAKKDMSYSDLSGYIKTINQTFNVNSKEYKELMPSANEAMALSLQNLERKNGTVLGAVYGYLKNTLGENYNPAQMMSYLDEALDLLDELKVDPNGKINVPWYNQIFGWKEITGNRYGALAVGTALGLKIEKQNAYDAILQNGQVVTLGDK